jgi:hypothetical protein
MHTNTHKLRQVNLPFFRDRIMVLHCYYLSIYLCVSVCICGPKQLEYDAFVLKLSCPKVNNQSNLKIGCFQIIQYLGNVFCCD